MSKVSSVKRGTGRERAEWFSLLDRWGATEREYREIATWLMDEHGVSKWWTQKIIVEYEQDRGVRQPGVRRDGTFEVSATKTIGAPIEEVAQAFTDARRRKRWLTDTTMKLTDSKPGRSARFQWNDGSRVSVTFEGKGLSKSTVMVSHDRITDAKKAQIAKERWRRRLIELKDHLQS